MLQSNAGDTERRLTFQPSPLAAESPLRPPTSHHGPSPSIMPEKPFHSRTPHHTVCNGRRTQPTTPSPGPHPARSSDSVADRNSEEEDGLVKEEEQSLAPSPGWAMRLVRIGGRRGVGVALEEEGCPAGGDVLTVAAQGGGTSDNAGGEILGGLVDEEERPDVATFEGVDARGMGTQEKEQRSRDEVGDAVSIAQQEIELKPHCSGGDAGALGKREIELQPYGEGGGAGAVGMWEEGRQSYDDKTAEQLFQDGRVRTVFDSPAPCGVIKPQHSPMNWQGEGPQIGPPGVRAATTGDGGFALVGIGSHDDVVDDRVFEPSAIGGHDVVVDKSFTSAIAVDEPISGATDKMEDEQKEEEVPPVSTKMPPVRPNASDSGDITDDGYAPQHLCSPPRASLQKNAIAPRNSSIISSASPSVETNEAAPRLAAPRGTDGFIESPVSSGGLPNKAAPPLAPPPVTEYERREKWRCDSYDEEEPSPRGSTVAADQSLDTVSLFSESSWALQDAPSNKRRRWAVSDFWARGQAAGDPQKTPKEGGESELEGARRLALSLAAKLKEKAWRCEGLESISGLRDDQVE